MLNPTSMNMRFWKSAPPAPSNLTAVPTDDHTIALNWTVNSTDEIGLNIYRSTDGINYFLINTVGAGTTAYNDDITSGTTYYYEVSAFNAGGESFSNSAFTNTLSLNLVSYWKLNEFSDGSSPVTRTDYVVASGNNLTDEENTPSTIGIIDNGLNLPTSTSKRMIHTSNLSLQINGSFTIDGWVKYATLSAFISIWGKVLNPALPAQLEYLVYVDSTRKASLRVSDGTTIVELRSADTITAGSFFYIAAWYDSDAQTLNIQINQNPVNTLSYTNGILPNAQLFQIGGGSVIDEVGFWKGRVLTDDERAARYNSGAGNTPPLW